MTSPPPIDLIADVVLDGVDVQEALPLIIRRGHRPANVIGLQDLQSAVAERRAVVDQVLPVNPVLDSLTPSIDEATRLESRVLFADPDDLARLEEAELQQISGQGAVTYQSLAQRRWRSAEAEAIFAETRSTVWDTVHRPITERAIERLNKVSRADLTELSSAVVRAIELITTTDDGSDHRTDATLRPLLTMIIGGNAAGTTVDRIVDELAWRRSAQHRLLSALDEPPRRQLIDAWRRLIGQEQRLPTAVADLVRQIELLRPSPEVDRRYDHLAGYLFADLIDPIAETAALDRLEHSLAQDYPGATLDDIDAESIGRLLGQRARQQLTDLRRIARTLASDGDPRPRIQRKLPRTALRRALSPELRRRLGAVPDADPDSPGLVLLVIDLAVTYAASWTAVRAAALAVSAMVHRYRPADTVGVLVINQTGAVERVGVQRIADLSPTPTDPVAPIDAAVVVGAIRRTVTRSGRTRAAALLIGGDWMARFRDATAIRRLDRSCRQSGWTCGLVQVEPAGLTRDQVTQTVRRAVGAMIDAWTR